MASQTASFQLSIRPVPRKHDAETLPQLIGRINEERGHFRNITEDSLQAEIEVRDAEAGEDVTIDEAPSSAEDVEARRKEIYAARAELLKYVGSVR